MITPMGGFIEGFLISSGVTAPVDVIVDSLVGWSVPAIFSAPIMAISAPILGIPAALFELPRTMAEMSVGGAAAQAFNMINNLFTGLI